MTVAWRAGWPTKYHPDQFPSSRSQPAMTIRTLLRMGDPRLLDTARPVTEFGTAELDELIRDLFDTMADAGGVGLAAPQIGVGLQVVIFGFDKSERYPNAESVPMTILINPVITPLSDAEELGFEGCLSVPGLRGEVPRFRHIRYQGFDPPGRHYRPDGGRLSRPRRAARMRPSDRHALPDAHARPEPAWLHRCSVSGRFR
jgi:peptide deformylase